MQSNNKLWDPKFAAVGLVIIALSVLILDFLPGIILGKVRGFFNPDALSPPKEQP